MATWFPTLDAAAGGTADAIEDTGGWVLGGVGSTVGNTVEGTAQTIGDTLAALGGGVGETAAGLTGPLFQGLGRWLLMAGIVIGAIVVIPRVM